MTQTYVIQDRRDGWVQALSVLAVGQDVEFDYSQIRPQGKPINRRDGLSIIGCYLDEIQEMK